MATIQFISKNIDVCDRVYWRFLSERRKGSLTVGGMGAIYKKDDNSVSFALPDNVDPLETMIQAAACFEAQTDPTIDPTTELEEVRIVTGPLSNPDVTSTVLTGKQFQQLVTAAKEETLHDLNIAIGSALLDMRRVAGFGGVQGTFSEAALGKNAPEKKPLAAPFRPL